MFYVLSIRERLAIVFFKSIQRLKVVGKKQVQVEIGFNFYIQKDTKPAIGGKLMYYFLRGNFGVFEYSCGKENQLGRTNKNQLKAAYIDMACISK